MFTFLPLGLRVLNKLQKIIDNELHQIGCQKVTLPTLTSGELWKTTGIFVLSVNFTYNHLTCL